MVDNLGALAGWFQKYKENKVVRNSLYGVAQFVVPTLLLLAVTPVLIHKLGADGYGLWMLATSALGLMSIAEFGLNTAIAKFVSEFASNKDMESLAAVVVIGLSTYIVLGFLLVVPVYIFAPVLAGIFIPSQSISVEQISSVVRIMSLGFIPLLLRSGSMAIPIGLQHFEIPLAVTTGYQIISYAVALGITIVSSSVTQIVTGTVVVLWMTAFATLLIAWRILAPFNLRFTTLPLKEISKRIFLFSLASGITGLGSRIFSYADRLAVGAVLGLDAAAYYTIIISAASKILQFSSALTGALMPAVSALVGAGNFQRVRSYFYQATLILVLINTCVGFFLIIAAAPLLSFWLGESIANHILTPFRVLALIYALISLNAPAHHVAIGIGFPWLPAWGSLIGGGTTIFLIMVLGKTYGLSGAAIANSGYLVVFILPIFMIIHLKKRFSENRTNE